MGAAHLKTMVRMMLFPGVLALAIAALLSKQEVVAATIPWEHVVHAVMFYVITMGLFLAFPRSRRMDIVESTLLCGILFQIVSRGLGRQWHLVDIIADAVGAFAVIAPTYVEEMRTSMRGAARHQRHMRRASDRAQRRTVQLGANAPTVGVLIEADSIQH
jgi:hypothetical protein